MTLFPACTRRKPRFCALAQAILSQAQDLENTIREIPVAHSPEGAGGVRLDALGSASGLPRPEGMADEDYRQYLLAKFALFTWDGTNETAQPLLESIFPGSTLSDNGDGTVTVRPISVLQAQYRLWPVPAGISAVQG